MSDIEKIEESAENGKMQTRRKLLTSAGRVAVTAPAVALLLSASSMPAAAHSQYDTTDTHAGADAGGYNTPGDPNDGGIGPDDSQGADLVSP